MGSIHRANLTISDKLSANCSERELAEIQAWVKRYQSVDDLKRKVAALTLAEQMSAATEWFESAEDREASEAGDDVLAAMAPLRRVLANRGLA